MNDDQLIFGRAMKESSAAQYLDRSPSWLSNGRRTDAKRLLEGKLPLFPRHTQQGRNVYYYREDLDAWLNQFKQPGGHPAWEEEYNHDMSGLKYQPGQAA